MPKNNGNNGNQKGRSSEELTPEEYAIIAAALTALADFFAFLSLIKARENTSNDNATSSTSQITGSSGGRRR
ncbi:hypothetical protein F4V43_03305 [Paenibacillus spiritus]|uniref:Uncharacterized protein n=1 Tax=Paenibacillus spiritus TaxID=2496557 RepID=A0A5J5GH81_9BACL|nr:MULTISPECIES: hypothetical protein [Paenibacillus]KAA9007531.1 hypothetical protein F4V43_03305 [Paenibacillus spiritus]